MNKPRRAKTRRLGPLPLDANETKCGICLDVVSVRGKIGPCSHLYCFPCLLEWAKVNNCCPQCKRIFRSITKVNFATGSFEDKIFIKDKTLPTGNSSDEEDVAPYLDSSQEISDFDVPDFIDDADLVVERYSDSEDEATFTQHPGKRRCQVFSPETSPVHRTPDKRLIFESPRSARQADRSNKSKKRCQILSDSESDQSGDDLFSDDDVETVSPPKQTHRHTHGTDVPESPSPSVFVSPQSCKKRKRNTSMSPGGSGAGGVFYTSPKYNKLARWSRLDQRVRKSKNLKLKKAQKGSISISTISHKQNTSQWLSTTKTKTSSRSPVSNKENAPPSHRLANGKFRLRRSPKTLQLEEQPEQYFTKMLDTL